MCNNKDENCDCNNTLKDNFYNVTLLLRNIEKVHTTELGTDRIKHNLNLSGDAVRFCKDAIARKECIITKRGKNWYCEIDDIVITINSYSYTIITAHSKDQ